MKYLLLSLSCLISFISCQSPKQGTPKDVDSLVQLIAQKKTELEYLQEEIKVLNEKLSLLDSSESENSRLVNTSVIQPQLFERYIEVQGTVVSDDLINVSGEIPGRIIRIPVQEGAWVKKGQLVATLDPESINKQIAEVEKSLELASDIYERQKRLWDQQIGSEMQFLQAKNNKERLEKTLETLNYNLSKANIYAPASGSVHRKVMSEGEISSPGMPILMILNTTNLRVNADIPEIYLRLIRLGQPVNVHFPAIQQTIAGKILRVGNIVDPANRTIEVEIRLLSRSAYLKPNLLAEVSFKEIEIQDAIVIPVEYVLQEVDGTEFVYTVSRDDGENRARKTYVVTGEAENGDIVITSGLQAGMELITKGARNVTAGELIGIQSQ